MKQEWTEIRTKIVTIHPVFHKTISLLEETLAKADNAAKVCNPEGVSWGIEAAKQYSKLQNAIEHTHAAGIISDDTRSELTKGLDTYWEGKLEKLVTEFAACIGKETEQEILKKLMEHVYELNPKCQEMLVKFAQQVREIERCGAEHK